LVTRCSIVQPRATSACSLLLFVWLIPGGLPLYVRAFVLQILLRVLYCVSACGAEDYVKDSDVNADDDVSCTWCRF